VKASLRLRFNRPAAGFCRRSFVFALLLVSAFAAGLPWLPDLPWSHAEFTLATTRRAVGRSLKALRSPFPDTARLIDRLLGDAEVVTAQENSLAFWDRSPGRQELAWGRVQATAREALTALRRRQGEADLRWHELAPAVATQVKQGLSEVEEAELGQREIAALRRAQYQADLAQRYAAAGDLLRANVAAVMALDATQIVHQGWIEVENRFTEPRNLAIWRTWVYATIERSRLQQEVAIVVDKLKRRLFLYYAGERIAGYRAELGAKGLRQKLHAGDQATPEGRYRILQRKDGGNTQYYKALLLDYPNDEDRARFLNARSQGVVPLRAGPGNLIEIHGDGGQGRDWTNGCVALANDDMERVFSRVRVGTPVTIVGTF